MKRIRRLLNRIPRPQCLAPGAGEGSENNNTEKDKKKHFSDLNASSAAPVEQDNNKSGLSVRQVFLLKQNWKGVMRNETDFGVDMFMRLFKTNEGLQFMFHNFKDITSDDELRSNEALEYHATMVMSTLDDAITHIDNYTFVQNLLAQTGASHKRFDGFAAETFLTIKRPFLDAVKVTLGDRYTENMENIYTIAIDFLVDTMVEGLREALADEDAPVPVAPIVMSMKK